MITYEELVESLPNMEFSIYEQKQSFSDGTSTFLRGIYLCLGENSIATFKVKGKDPSKTKTFVSAKEACTYLNTLG